MVPPRNTQPAPRPICEGVKYLVSTPFGIEVKRAELSHFAQQGGVDLGHCDVEVELRQQLRLGTREQGRLMSHVSGAQAELARDPPVEQDGLGPVNWV